MAYYHKIPPKTQFTKTDNKIMGDPSLSMGARVLYALMLEVKPGVDWSDKFFSNKLGVSTRSVTTFKKELRNCGLLYTERIGPKLYHKYIGHSKLMGKTIHSIEDRKINENND